MPGDKGQLTRGDLPEELTPETLRRLPISVLRRLARPGNGILRPDEQEGFDAALHEVMSGAARRVSNRLNRSDWAAVVRTAADDPRHSGTGRPSRADANVRRLARRIGQQVDLAEGLAPGVDWSFAQPDALPSAEPEAGTATEAAGDAETVTDLEERLADQVELVQVMSEMAEVQKRTYALEQQRELQTTRGLFFGFAVSVAVIIAGWAPVVTADDWAERGWVLGLTLVTVGAAGVVYALIRRYQNSQLAKQDAEET